MLYTASCHFPTVTYLQFKAFQLTTKYLLGSSLAFHITRHKVSVYEIIPQRKVCHFRGAVPFSVLTQTTSSHQGNRFYFVSWQTFGIDSPSESGLVLVSLPIRNLSCVVLDMNRPASFNNKCFDSVSKVDQ